MTNRFLIEGAWSVIGSPKNQSKQSQQKKPYKVMGKELRKKITSVEPPDTMGIGGLDFKIKTQIGNF